MHIGIVGLGLIGGSLALDWRRAGHTITGVSRSGETVALAQERGVIDRGGLEVSLLHPCEVVVLCVPLDRLVAMAIAVCPHLKPDAILTDVGSVKAPVVQAITPFWPGFIGGHPMAGTAEQGIQAAQPHLFRQRPYVLTPTPQSDPRQLAQLQTLIQALGAQEFLCDPHAHDRAVAWISHLPIWVSAALLGAFAQEPDPQIYALAQQLASSGWRDTTRVGGGNPELGVCLVHYNRENILRGLRQYQQELAQVIGMVEQQDIAALTAYLHHSQGLRHNHRLDQEIGSSPA
ncbi:arogenate dehydrogenase [Gloeomargarita lithophora Alchichica-D10]|uniref:Arogenate dehydrogenase n=1 Tax=Gloeomargarita lithophora Alchichica-D10 TaxID=1188229 RepID=A0A1J0AC61_9CYAN|nr:prephenate/arogenate dehydrogenase [Gloeomargarita lithophora]APB33515.1 arogenate dehydrogenase [Gloeomargarita lithophora Alchichica-D10]